MVNLSTKYMGLNLSNPIIAASSGLTSTLSDIVELEANGAGAVVLKSLFEEEIIMEAHDNLNRMHASGFIYPETIDYFDYDEMEDPVANFLKLISDAKKSVSIPIIASINCVTANKWPDFAIRIQGAGADAIELNIFALPTDFNRTSEDNEKFYFDVIEKVTQLVSIPVAVKISPYNASLANFIKRLSETPIKSIVLFNRFYSPDFDIYNFEFTASSVFSSPAELALPLRWTAIMSERISCDIAASTGIHDGNALIKVLLAGANAGQIATTLYKNGFGHIKLMQNQITQWMQEKGYKSIDEFRGKMSQARTYNPAAFERVQFMRFFREMERLF
jgi:dihydroorotate dehydrogenase (fumarate)